MKLKETIRMAATVRATIAGLNLVDAARKKKGWTKRDEVWAGLATTSKSTLGRFWSGVPISTETFKQICLAVGIAESDWEELVSTEGLQESYGRSGKSHAVITLDVRLDDISPEDLHLLVTRLAKYGLSLRDVTEGSIRLLLEGSPEDIAAINAIHLSGELSAILSASVRSVQRVDLAGWIREHNGEALCLRFADLGFAYLRRANLGFADLRSADLRSAILSFAILSDADLRASDLRRANLHSADLHDANLGFAILSFSNLRNANLRGANLRGANVTATQFGSGKGLSELDKAELKRRGAIFDAGMQGVLKA
ncbi:MAG: pentapeptide repeat-containing protein [Cyanobacteria bacterium P01_D01_bin.105]